MKFSIDDIGAAGEAFDDLLSLGPGKIHGDRPLAAIAGVEIGGITSAIAIVDRGRSPLPCIVAGKALDLDDLGAKIGEQLTGPRARQNASKFEDLQAGKGWCHSCLPSRTPLMTAASQKNAWMPVMARPRMRAWMSWVPS